MRTLTLIALLAASTCWANQQTPVPPNPEATVTPQQTSIVIPAGTRIPLTLTSQISTKARHGDTVRAVTGFPVTVGTQMAIPIGTSVEGVVDKVARGGRSGPILQMHFTRLIYANGYSVQIDGANVHAEVTEPRSSQTAMLASPPVEDFAFPGEFRPEFALAAAPTVPTLQPTPSHTGAIGAIIAVGVGGTVAAIVIGIMAARHGGGGSGVLFDSGWQFEMVLQSPLTVDAQSVVPASDRP